MSTGKGMLSNNMFSYCRSNPVCRRDVRGTIEEDCLTGDDKEDLVKQPDGGYSGSGSGTATDCPTGQQTGGKGFSSFGALKSFLGSAGAGKHWHHIVEQCQTQKSGFTSEQVNNTSNVIAVDSGVHSQITGHYNSTKFDFTGGLSVRNWLAGQPFEVQFEYGMNVLRDFGVIQ